MIRFSHVLPIIGSLSLFREKARVHVGANDFYDVKAVMQSNQLFEGVVSSRTIKAGTYYSPKCTI